jgi:hypothetical protein
MTKRKAVWSREDDLSRAGCDGASEVRLIHWEAFRLWRKGLHLVD